MENFEELLGDESRRLLEQELSKDLHQFLLSMKEVDERMPECPDVEEKWEEIAKAYIPDGIREFQDYPSASLGWMMYIGMAVAKMWDTEWDIYSKIEDLYTYMRDKRGYDAMDEYIREEVLLLQGVAPTTRTWHEGCLQWICRLPAPAIPLWNSHAVETNGLSHDEYVIVYSSLITGILASFHARMPPLRFTHL